MIIVRDWLLFLHEERVVVLSFGAFWFTPGLLSAIPVSFIFSLVECEYSCVYPYHTVVR